MKTVVPIISLSIGIQGLFAQNNIDSLVRENEIVLKTPATGIIISLAYKQTLIKRHQ